MGIIYSGWHVTLDQPVAVKVIRKELINNADAVQRFIEEARALAQLRGPHVAQVLDAGIEDGSPFIVMELLEGRDLRTLLEEHQQLTPERAVELVREACEAVAEAHAKGIVHRDLKPENLFLVDSEAGEGTLKVIDFGISARVDGSYTEQALGPGSPEYMAPEQLLPGKLVDHRADIWSLGIVLFELLAGAVPFTGESAHEICSGVVAGEVPTLKSRNVEISEGLEAIVLRCLSKSADERFHSALELAAALAPYAGLVAGRSLTPPEVVERASLADVASVSDDEDLAADLGVSLVPRQSLWSKAKAKSQVGAGLAAGCVLGVVVYAMTQRASDEGPAGASSVSGAGESRAAESQLNGHAPTSNGPKVLPVLGEETEVVQQKAQSAARNLLRPVPSPARVGIGEKVPSAAPVALTNPAEQELDSELESIGEELAPLVESNRPSGEQAAEARYALAASSPNASEQKEKAAADKKVAADKKAAAESKPVSVPPPAPVAPDSTPAKVSFPDVQR
jgi:serine/threonine-protein kinase